MPYEYDWLNSSLAATFTEFQKSKINILSNSIKLVTPEVQVGYYLVGMLSYNGQNYINYIDYNTSAKKVFQNAKMTRGAYEAMLSKAGLL